MVNDKQLKPEGALNKWPLTFIGSNAKEAARADTCVSLSDELQLSLKKINLFHEAYSSLLLELDPYGDKTYTLTEIQQFLELCDLLTNTANENNIQTFSKDLRELCQRAVQERKLLFAFGD